ncbi:hypothetical protein LguiA_010352 [Lonicera macranthoides]
MEKKTDLSWVQSLVKESPPEIKEKFAAPVFGGAPFSENIKSNSQIEFIDHSSIKERINVSITTPCD